MTSSNCCSVILRMVASRVMPALFTMTSTVPNAAVAASSRAGHVAGGGDVAADSDGVGAQRCGGLLGLGFVEVADDDSGAVVGERAGDRQSDALGASGDDGGASGQHVQVLSSRGTGWNCSAWWATPAREGVIGGGRVHAGFDE